MLSPEVRGRLMTILAEARDQGFVSPGPVEPHLEHAEAFAAIVGPKFAGRFLDLGAGAGVPGLVLLATWPETTGTLLESHGRRCRFLEAAIAEMGVPARAAVACGRAEALARQPDLRGVYDLVTARAFGPPAPTAECAVGFLRPGGRLVVSEPPGPSVPSRWPADGLAELGFGSAEFQAGEGTGVAVLTLREGPRDRWPRRVGVPAKRPLWREQARRQEKR